MERSIPDVQSERPEVELELDRVGLLRVRMPLGGPAKLGDGLLLQSPVFTAFVNLPPSQRGIHASRSYETIYDALSSIAWRRGKLEDIASEIVGDLLRRHEYADRAEVKISGTLFRQVKAPVSKKASYERFKVKARAIGRRTDSGPSISRSIGVTVYGVTACPCAQKVIKSILDRGGLRGGELVATHMQRTLASAELGLVGDESVDMLELADVVKACMSAPVYDLLKRMDEAYLVMQAVRRPVFVEDAARMIALRVARSFSGLSPETSLRIIVKSLESIHSHDFLAEFRTKIGLLR